MTKDIPILATAYCLWKNNKSNTLILYKGLIQLFGPSKNNNCMLLIVCSCCSCCFGVKCVSVGGPMKRCCGAFLEEMMWRFKNLSD